MWGIKMFQKNKAPSEGEVCRAVYDRHDVLKYQITEKCLEYLRSGQNTLEKQQMLKREIDSLFDQHTDGLVKNISNLFS